MKACFLPIIFMLLRLLQKHLAHKYLPDYFYSSFHVGQLISAKTLYSIIISRIGFAFFSLSVLYHYELSGIGFEAAEHITWGFWRPMGIFTFSDILETMY